MCNVTIVNTDAVVIDGKEYRDGDVVSITADCFSSSMSSITGAIFVSYYERKVFILNNKTQGQEPNTNDWKRFGYNKTWCIYSKDTNYSPLITITSYNIVTQETTKATDISKPTDVISYYYSRSLRH